jgi:hypothetical protein
MYGKASSALPRAFASVSESALVALAAVAGMEKAT